MDVRRLARRPSTRQNQTVTLPPMPWRLPVVLALVAGFAGAVFGLVRGLSYVPTLPFAIVEGCLLFGVPAALLGFVLAGCWSVGSRLRRHNS